jgi:hypothetical protein
VIAEPAAPRGRDPFVPLQFAYRPGNGMTISESSEGLSVMAMLVVAAAPVPPVVVPASPVHVSVAVAVTAPMPDLNHSAVRRGHRGNAQPGGSGYGHCQQRKTDQADTSHTVSSRSRDCDVRHKFPAERLFRRA